MPFKEIRGRRAREDNRVIEIVFYEKNHECILDKLSKTNLEKVTYCNLRLFSFSYVG